MVVAYSQLRRARSTWVIATPTPNQASLGDREVDANGRL